MSWELKPIPPKRLSQIYPSIHPYIDYYTNPLLKLVDLVFRIPKLLQHASRTSQSLLHSRWSTHKHHVALWCHLLQQFLGHISFPEFAAFLRVANSVDCLEPVGERLLILLEFLTEKDISVGVYTKHKRDGGLILWVAQDPRSELVDGGNARTTSNKGDVGESVGLPLVSWESGGEEKCLARLEVVKMGGLLAIGILLHEELDVALFICWIY